MERLHRLHPREGRQVRHLRAVEAERLHRPHPREGGQVRHLRAGEVELLHRRHPRERGQKAVESLYAKIKFVRAGGLRIGDPSFCLFEGIERFRRHGINIEIITQLRHIA